MQLSYTLQDAMVFLGSLKNGDMCPRFTDKEIEDIKVINFFLKNPRKWKNWFLNLILGLLKIKVIFINCIPITSGNLQDDI